MPKCVTLSTSHVDPQRETACLRECVRTLHRSHVQVFNHMLEEEDRQEREAEVIRVKRESEEAQRERKRIEVEKERAREIGGLVKM